MKAATKRRLVGVEARAAVIPDREVLELRSLSDRELAVEHLCLLSQLRQEDMRKPLHSARCVCGACAPIEHYVREARAALAIMDAAGVDDLPHRRPTYAAPRPRPSRTVIAIPGGVM